MKEKQYHHGNLHNALIEAGIGFVNENGMNNFSLRKVAAQCNVSHAAAYSHFKDKDALIDAMKEYVKNRFAEQLEQTIATHRQEGNQAVIYALASTYVTFFQDNPAYYNFIFNHGDIVIDIQHIETVNNYKPFEIFKQAAICFLEDLDVPKEKQMDTLLGMWAVVHGITGIAVTTDSAREKDWNEFALSILHNQYTIRKEEKIR